MLKKIFFLLFFLSLVPSVLAQERLESDNYRIQFPNLNSGAGIPSSTNFKVDSTIGQTAAGLFTSNGYLVKSGFQYIHSIIPFSFSISKIQVAFGTLVPGTPSLDSDTTLTVSSGGASGYQVKAAENHPLQVSGAASTIPDTTCDGSDCNEETAGVWSTDSIYGFGFNIDGNDKSADFADTTYFRQFADLSNSEAPQAIMESVNTGNSRQATVTYKVNVSGVQPAGTYQNIVTYTAIPGY